MLSFVRFLPFWFSPLSQLHLCLAFGKCVRWLSQRDQCVPSALYAFQHVPLLLPLDFGVLAVCVCGALTFGLSDCVYLAHMLDFGSVNLQRSPSHSLDFVSPRKNGASSCRCVSILPICGCGRPLRCPFHSPLKDFDDTLGFPGEGPKHNNNKWSITTANIGSLRQNKHWKTWPSSVCCLQETRIGKTTFVILRFLFVIWAKSCFRVNYSLG